MTDRRTDPSLQDLNPGLLLGAALMLAVGGVLGLAGIALGGAAVIAASRRWYHRADLPPSQLAKLKWEQAKAAAGAGAGAWRDTEETRHAAR
ncbi:hypothetical protein [Pseudonocardia asaccharolytica]|nr:hypothetical protein [Pseudonocardia asaccharolytica]